MPLAKNTIATTRTPTSPVLIIDPATNTTYVLVRADVYEQMLGGGQFDPRDTYPFVEQVMREDDDRDPILAGYQRIASTVTTR